EAYRRTYFIPRGLDDFPANPQPWQPADWDVTRHSRDPSTWHALEPMPAMHGHNCAPPPATHAVASYADAVFVCNGHLMTALHGSGYGVISLTPSHLVDFSAGEARIRFDLSTLRTSPRDWIDLWVSPYAEHLQLPLEAWLPDLNGPPAHAVHVKIESLNGTTPFKAFVYRDFFEQDLGGDAATGYESVLVPSATRRDTFELRISRTHVQFGMPAYDLWWVDSEIADLGWDQGVVQRGRAPALRRPRLRHPGQLRRRRLLAAGAAPAPAAHEPGPLPVVLDPRARGHYIRRLPQPRRPRGRALAGARCHHLVERGPCRGPVKQAVWDSEARTTGLK